MGVSKNKKRKEKSSSKNNLSKVNYEGFYTSEGGATGITASTLMVPENNNISMKVRVKYANSTMFDDIVYTGNTNIIEIVPMQGNNSLSEQLESYFSTVEFLSEVLEIFKAGASSIKKSPSIKSNSLIDSIILEVNQTSATPVKDTQSINYLNKLLFIGGFRTVAGVKEFLDVEDSFHEMGYTESEIEGKTKNGYNIEPISFTIIDNLNLSLVQGQFLNSATYMSSLNSVDDLVEQGPNLVHISNSNPKVRNKRTLKVQIKLNRIRKSILDYAKSIGYALEINYPNKNSERDYSNSDDIDTKLLKYFDIKCNNSKISDVGDIKDNKDVFNLVALFVTSIKILQSYISSYCELKDSNNTTYKVNDMLVSGIVCMNCEGLSDSRIKTQLDIFKELFDTHLVFLYNVDSSCTVSRGIMPLDNFRRTK